MKTVVTDLLPFKEAVNFLEGRDLLPTKLTHEEMQSIDASLRERAFWSARTTNAKFLQHARDIIRQVTNPKTVTRKGEKVVRGFTVEQAVSKIREAFPDVHGDSRVHLIVSTQADMTRGFGYWKQGQKNIEMWPCYELFRGEERKEPRDWPSRWAEHGGEFFEGESDYPEGRMIARKNDPIWVAISDFGNPYEPFAFNSGMVRREIDRDEAIELGVIQENEQLEEQDLDLAEDMQAPMEDIDEDLRDQLIADLGPEYAFEDGVLVKKY